MSCKICGRGACTASFHSLEAQTAFEEIDSLSEDEAKRELSDAKDEIDTLRQRAERAEADCETLKQLAINNAVGAADAVREAVEAKENLQSAQSTIAELRESLRLAVLALAHANEQSPGLYDEAYNAVSTALEGKSTSAGLNNPVDGKRQPSG